MSLLKNIRLSSASKQCAACSGGPQRLVYVVSAADKDKHASAVPPTLRQRCPRGFYQSKQRYGAPRLTDELRAQGYPFNVKTVAASLRRQGLMARPPGSSARSATAHTACLCQKICWSRIFTPVARTRSGQETSRTYVQMKAGCIWQWSLTCGHVPLLAGQCRHA